MKYAVSNFSDKRNIDKSYNTSCYFSQKDDSGCTFIISILILFLHSPDNNPLDSEMRWLKKY